MWDYAYSLIFIEQKKIWKIYKHDANIRLVKGAYKEPSDLAFHLKKDVDENFLHLSKIMLKFKSEKKLRVAFATHDENLCSLIIREAKHYSAPKDQFEFQMLYGIKSGYQRELANHGYQVRVLISYGDFWYPWYMRRLAERPANIWFVLKIFLTLYEVKSLLITRFEILHRFAPQNLR